MSLAVAAPPPAVPPTRPLPTVIQPPGVHSDGSYTGESGSSHGQQTSGSFVVLPPGAKMPSPPPQDHPIELAIPPAPQRRLSRAAHKPLPALPRDTKTPKTPKTFPQPPPSWAVHFRGFVKAVKWSKSTPQLHPKSNPRDFDPEKYGKQSLAPLRVVKTAVDKAATDGARVKPLTKAPLPASGGTFPSLAKLKKPLPPVSSNAGGVFLVPHIQSAPPASGVQQELRPPSTGWMHPVPVNPYDFTSVRTIIGHASVHSRTSMDNMYLTSPSPPLAELPVRKSVSEIGHGSISYAALSPDPSMSSIEQFPTFPAISANASQDIIASNRPSIDLAPDTEIQHDHKRHSRIRIDSIKRALSFKRPSEFKSTSDIPSSTSNTSPIETHRKSNSTDIDRPVSNFIVDDNGRRRLRRRSTLGDASRSISPSSFRMHEPPKFTIGPDVSNSSLVSNGGLSATSPTPSSSMGVGSRPAARRRLTKRRPSEKSRSSLPTTIEVDTPKSLDKPNPMESLDIPSQPYFSPYPSHIPVFSTSTPAADTPISSLPPSAPTLVANTAALPPPPPPKQIETLAPSQIAEDIPPVPPLPPHLQSAPHSTIITTLQDWTTPVPSIPPGMTSIKSSAPPSAMLNMRPKLPHRPSLERRASRRRWTLDIAAQDIDDDILKQELERLRLLGEPSGGGGIGAPDSGWTLARKALLSSREIILTERTYLNHISRFLSEFASDTGTPPLLRQHLPLLISASQAFCNRMSEDPSVWGVSAAFVSVEAVLEQVLVDYCQVVSQVMVACRQTSNQSHKSSPSSSSGPKLPILKRNTGNGFASEFGKLLPPLPTDKSSEKLANDKEKEKRTTSSGHAEEKEKKGNVPRSKSVPGKASKWRMSLPMSSNGSSTSLASNHGPSASTASSPTTAERQGSWASGKAKAITALDIAIAPPQRVTRYVLLYKDLLNGTPLTAPSRPLIQRALDGALRIAEKCDKAQSDQLFVSPTAGGQT